MSAGSVCEKDICLFCPEIVEDLNVHLVERHQQQCFQCGICHPTQQCFYFYSDAVKHFHEFHGISNPEADYQLFAPAHVGLVKCSFCSPPKIFLGKKLDALIEEAVDHVTVHRDVHHGDKEIIDVCLTLQCRFCTSNTRESQAHIQNHADQIKGRRLDGTLKENCTEEDIPFREDKIAEKVFLIKSFSGIQGQELGSMDRVECCEDNTSRINHENCYESQDVNFKTKFSKERVFCTNEATEKSRKKNKFCKDPLHDGRFQDTERGNLQTRDDCNNNKRNEESTRKDIFSLMNNDPPKHKKRQSERFYVEQFILVCKFCTFEESFSFGNVHQAASTHFQVHSFSKWRLKQSFFLKCSVCNLSTKDLLSFDCIFKHVRSHRIQRSVRGKPAVCCYCPEPLNNQDSGAHVIENHISDLFSCVLCLKVFHLNIEVVIHLRDAHGYDPGSSSEYISRPAGLGSCLCLLCLQPFFSMDLGLMDGHFQLCHNRSFDGCWVRYSCRVCPGKTFQSEADLLRHVTVCHHSAGVDKAVDSLQTNPLSRLQLKWLCSKCMKSNHIELRSCIDCRYTRPSAMCISDRKRHRSLKRTAEEFQDSLLASGRDDNRD